jgi:TolB protein
MRIARRNPSRIFRILSTTGACAAVLAYAACSDNADDNAGAPTATTSATSSATVASPTSGAGAHQIVYEASDGASTNVYTIDASTGEAEQLTFDTGQSGHPAWKPDLSRIIFTSNRGGLPARNLFTMNPDGSDVQQLTNDPEVDHWAPKYSPDMTQIVFVEVTKGEGSSLTLMNADGTNQHRISGRYNFAEFPAWTRDGKLIYFAAIATDRNNIDLYSIDPATGETKTIVQTNAGDVCPHFSYDGSRMTYATGAPDNPQNVDLYAREAPLDSHTDIGDDLRLTEDAGFDDYSNASPDDSTYVFLSRRDGNTELYLMDYDGGNERRLTNTPDLEENVPDW